MCEPVPFKWLLAWPLCPARTWAVLLFFAAHVALNMHQHCQQHMCAHAAFASQQMNLSPFTEDCREDSASM